MRNLLLSLIFVATCAISHAANIVPQPTHYKAYSSEIVVTRQTRICVPNVALRVDAEYLRQYLPLECEIGEGGEGDIVLRTSRNLEVEGYQIEVNQHNIEIVGGSRAGLFNGVQTLLQMLPAEVYSGGLSLPIVVGCAEVEDSPKYPYRGMMLDVARTWFDVDKVKRYIDLLSHHKINKLHFHLTDDEGWRIEIKSHPELALEGGFRGGDSPIAAVYGAWGERYGGYYTQEELKRLVAYAAVRNVEIIPEIDLPGHSRTIAKLHPEILCPFEYNTAPLLGYDDRSAWCVAREENYALLGDILAEVAQLFPSQYIYIGGDEVDFSQWKSCPECNRLMREHGFDDYHLLQDLFIGRLVDTLSRYGKLPAVWNESARTATLTRQARVHGWESVEECRKATSKGYRTVVMPGQYFYFDMRQTPTEAGHNWAAIFDAEKSYSFDLAKQGFSLQQQERIEGFEAAFFSEAYIAHNPASCDYVDYMLFPRVCALSEVAWGSERSGWQAFYTRLKDSHYDRMEAMGIAFRLFPPKVKYEDGEFEVASDDGSKLYYRIDGTDEEHLFDGHLTADKPQLYTFISRRGLAHSPEVAHKSYYKTVRPAVSITSSLPESLRYPLSRAASYSAQAWSRRAGKSGDWILYTFDKVQDVRSIRIKTGNRHLPKNIFDAGYVEVSSDGKTFERIAELYGGEATIRPKNGVKAIRVVCTADGNGCRHIAVQPLEIKQ